VKKAASGGFALAFFYIFGAVTLLTLIAHANAHNYFKEDKKDE
jgi:hypothetical protein